MRLLALLTITAALGTATSQAADFKFVGEADGDFLAPTNWVPEGPPSFNDIAVVDGSASTVLSDSVEISRLALGNDATLKIASGGVLSVGKNHLYVGISGFNGVEGVGTATLELEEGGELSVDKFYLAAYDPPGRNGRVVFAGGKVFVAERFWVGANALNDGVTGELTIQGSKLTWETPTAEIRLGSGKGNAILNLVFDESGISHLTAKDVQLGNEKLILNVDLTAAKITTATTIPLITYSGTLQGEFGDIFLEGMPEGHDGTITYGPGENGTISLEITKR